MPLQELGWVVGKVQNLFLRPGTPQLSLYLYGRYVRLFVIFATPRPRRGRIVRENPIFGVNATGRRQTHTN
jgi:hypothetical protein